MKLPEMQGARCFLNPLATELVRWDLDDGVEAQFMPRTGDQLQVRLRVGMWARTFTIDEDSHGVDLAELVKIKETFLRQATAAGEIVEPHIIVRLERVAECARALVQYNVILGTGSLEAVEDATERVSALRAALAHLEQP